MTHDQRLQEMAENRKNMQWADGVTRNTETLNIGGDGPDDHAWIEAAFVWLDDPEATTSDLENLLPIRETVTLCDQTGERQSLPVLLSGPTSDDDEITAWRIVEPKWVSPYDKAFLALRNAEARLEALPADDAHYHERQKALLPLSRAKAEYRLELERSTDDVERERRRIDEERFYGIGTDERNADRRAKDRPNDMTGEPVTPEGVAAQKLASKKRIRAAMTPEQAAAAKAARNEKDRLAYAAKQAKAALK